MGLLAKGFYGASFGTPFESTHANCGGLLTRSDSGCSVNRRSTMSATHSLSALHAWGPAGSALVLLVCICTRLWAGLHAVHELSLRSSLQRLKPGTADANEERRRDLLAGGHPSRDLSFQSRGPCPVLARINLTAQYQKRHGEGTRFDLDENALGPIATCRLTCDISEPSKTCKV